jgi:hypothetical protein
MAVLKRALSPGIVSQWSNVVLPTQSLTCWYGPFLASEGLLNPVRRNSSRCAYRLLLGRAAFVEQQAHERGEAWVRHGVGDSIGDIRIRVIRVRRAATATATASNNFVGEIQSADGAHESHDEQFVGVDGLGDGGGCEWVRCCGRE